MERSKVSLSYREVTPAHEVWVEASEGAARGGLEPGESDPGLRRLEIGSGEVDAAVGQLALLHLGTGHVDADDWSPGRGREEVTFQCRK